MKNNILINYKPINFLKQNIFILLKVISVFIAGWFLLYILSTETKRGLITSNLNVGVIVLAIVIAIVSIQSYVNKDIYIYRVEIISDYIDIYWQERRLFEKISTKMNTIEVKILPSGKNTPVLQIIMKNENKIIKLKQTYYPGWDKNTMDIFCKKIEELKNNLSI